MDISAEVQEAVTPWRQLWWCTIQIHATLILT